MERRSFLKALAGGTAAAQLLPDASSGQTPTLAQLRADLEGASDDASYWARVREEFSSLEYTYLNCSTIGVTPQSVVQSLIGYIQLLETYPRGYVFGGFPGAGFDAVRNRAAEFIGANASEVAITRNTTEGMNLVATSLKLSPGDQVLMTDKEHPGGYVGWEHKQRQEGIQIVRMPMPTFVESKDQILDLVRSHLTPSTKVVSICHIMTETGLQMPIAEIAEIVKPRGILLVCDGAHGPGMLDVDVKALGVDTYASSSHKWMLAPKGSGLLYISSEVQDRIQPAMLSAGTSVYTGATGTRNAATVAAHGDAMLFHNTIGRGRVEARARQLQAYLREQMSTLPGVRPMVPDTPELSSGVTTYAFEQGNANDLFSALRGKWIDVKAEPHNSLRISTHVLNSEEEIDLLVGELRILMGLSTAVRETEAPTPQLAALSPNYPNPLNASTQIPFELSRDGFVQVDIVDALGQVVATPVDGWLVAGQHEATWHAAGAAAGVYFCRLRTSEGEQSRKMALVP